MLMEKYEKLKDILEELDSFAVAFSGGVDSSFLLYVGSKILNKNVLAITVRADMYPAREINEAEKIAGDLKLVHKILEVDEYSIRGFVENKEDRCYHCKKAIFETIISEAKKENIAIIVDGTNFDDLDDFRPGMTALRELNIRSPLKEAGLTKDEIRQLSKDLNIPTWNKDSMACLASRIPYNTEITRDKLSRVEKCENYLRDLGYRGFRVRYHNDLARIELKKEDLRDFLDFEYLEDIIGYFKRVGFKYITLDLEGYTYGSMNKQVRKDIIESWKI